METSHSQLRSPYNSPRTHTCTSGVGESENVKLFDIQQLSEDMSERAKKEASFTDEEMEDIMASIKKLLPEEKSSIDINELYPLIQSVCHLSHKDWDRTGHSAEKMSKLLLRGEGDREDEIGISQEFKDMFKRVFEEGNWDGAMQHSIKNNEGKGKPWAILVTGVNGIRKTTSVYQPWFQEVLHEALINPSIDIHDSNSLDKIKMEMESLPTGENSFFRQLDHIIITLINRNFQKLYEMTSKSHNFGNDDDDDDDNDRHDPPSSETIQMYSNYKAALFSRFRTFSEIIGVLLVRQAIAKNMNIMVETSGRDIAMFHYIDTFFSSENYNKLVIHFTINDLSHAESSVDDRMLKEIRDGIDALKTEDIQNIIKANAGGPYGSEVLQGIQRDSDAVWEKIVSESKEENHTGSDWFKAHIQITAEKKGKDWTANAVLPDNSLGSTFTFVPPRQI